MNIRLCLVVCSSWVNDMVYAHRARNSSPPHQRTNGEAHTLTSQHGHQTPTGSDNNNINNHKRVCTSVVPCALLFFCLPSHPLVYSPPFLLLPPQLLRLRATAAAA